MWRNITYHDITIKLYTLGDFLFPHFPPPPPYLKIFFKQKTNFSKARKFLQFWCNFHLQVISALSKTVHLSLQLQTIQRFTLKIPTSITLHGTVLCKLMVTFPWPRSPGPIEFDSMDNDSCLFWSHGHTERFRFRFTLTNPYTNANGRRFCLTPKTGFNCRNRCRN